MNYKKQAAQTFIGTLVVSALLATPARAEDGATLGSRWSDGLDTRHAAQRLSQAFGSAGYSSSADINGATADDTWTRLQSAQVFASFTHANAGVLAVQSSATEKQYLLGGIATDVVSVVPNARMLAEFRPLVDIDDLKLAIFAGCLSAKSSATEGDLDDMATRRGVDSVVTYAGKIEFPSTQAGSAPSDANYSGNYYYSRVATYLAGGATIESALKRAITDLVSKEGSNASYDTYRISGSSATPASVRITPARSGAMQGPTQAVFGLLPLNLTQSASTRQYEVPSVGLVHEYDLGGGSSTMVRYLADGSLYDVVSEATSTGEVMYAPVEAAMIARTFAQRHVTEFDLESWTMTVNDEGLSRQAGERVASYTWQAPVTSAVAQTVTSEVDRRTGQISYFHNAKAPRLETDFTVTRNEAAVAAAQHVGQEFSAVETVEAYRWDRAMWRVTVDRSDRGAASAKELAPVQVIVDGVTGEILRAISS